MFVVSIPAGMGDMAVSNSIGSNVFDILIGLGLPWALQTLAVNYGSYVSPAFVHIIVTYYLFTYLFLISQIYLGKKMTKILWILSEKTSNFLCYMGEVEINCHWTFPILLRTNTSISSLKTEVCAEVS